ncbi:hypothetical protein HMPREF0454_03923 [Hafnia alvei ATCC 51873]|uniref:Uncharacterized protein n=1 Tax=Hafnia alvei ATCC 51873 TaxID=1002364 RepID=G9YBE4_HAFAL|nr:hypothetical protein HMPREF0454_03923 [Hafnia alvei ATCC 51873]
MGKIHSGQHKENTTAGRVLRISCCGGANQGVDLYRRMSQASRKGQMFDDCLKHARVWANRYGLAEEKPASVKKTKKPNQTKTLF